MNHELLPGRKPEQSQDTPQRPSLGWGEGGGGGGWHGEGVGWRGAWRVGWLRGSQPARPLSGPVSEPSCVMDFAQCASPSHWNSNSCISLSFICVYVRPVT